MSSFFFNTGKYFFPSFLGQSLLEINYFSNVGGEKYFYLYDKKLSSSVRKNSSEEYFFFINISG
jgi:hypothetical protein